MADANLEQAAGVALGALSESDPDIVTNYLGEKSRWQLEPRGNLSPIPGIGAAAPAAQGGTGSAGQTIGRGGGGGAGSAATGGRGANILGAAEKALEALLKGAPLLPGEDLGARGDVGGQGTPQDANTSLSDTLRSAIASVPSDAEALAGRVPLNQTITPDPSSQMSARDVALENLGPEGAQAASGYPGAAPSADVLPELDPGALAGSGEASAGGAGTAGGGAGGLGAGAGAVAAILGAIAEATGNKDLGTAAAALGDVAGGLGTATAVSSALAPALASTAFGSAEAAAAGASAGLGVGAGAAFAPIAAMLIATSIANMISPGSAPDLSDLWTSGGTDFKGMSKLLSEKRTKAAQVWDQSSKTMQDALTAAQAAQKGDITDPAKLRAIGDALMRGETSYYQQTPVAGSSVGPSSYITGANRPDAMRPFVQGMSEWLAINKALMDQGQPGLVISPDMAGATGLLTPVGETQDPQYGTTTPDWGPAGPPPVDFEWGGIQGQAATVKDPAQWNDPNSPLQQWLRNKFMAYEQAGGIPTGTWASAAPTPEQQQQQRAAQAAVAALGGGMPLSGPTPAATTMGELNTGLDKNLAAPDAAQTAVAALTSPFMGAGSSGLDRNLLPTAA